MIKNKKSQYLLSTFRLLVSILIVALLITFLKYVKWDYGISFIYIPKVSSVIKRLGDCLYDFDFYNNIIVSIFRVYGGFFIAMITAITLAFLIEENNFFRHYLYPVFEIIRPIPNAAWVPLSIMMFKTIEGSVVFITFISAFFPILINTLDGLDNVIPNYKKIAKSFKVSKFSYIFEVLLPASLPNIFTGLKLGMSGSWLGVVIAEMISGQSGIGYMTWTCYTLIDLDGVVVGMLVIGSLGAISSLIIRIINKRFFKWAYLVNEGK